MAPSGAVIAYHGGRGSWHPTFWTDNNTGKTIDSWADVGVEASQDDEETWNLDSAPNTKTSQTILKIYRIRFARLGIVEYHTNHPAVRKYTA